MERKLLINPWVGMWIRPRQTICAVTEFNPHYLLPLLYLIYGFPLLLQMAQNFSLGDKFFLEGIVVGALIGALIVGWMGINTVAALFYWSGKLIGGAGSFPAVRAAVGWSTLPNVVNILIWVVNMAYFGKQIFTHRFVEGPFVGGELALIFFGSLTQVVIAIWGFIMILKALSQVQQFSIWKGLLNVVMPVVIVLIGVSLLAWVLSIIAVGEMRG